MVETSILMSTHNGSKHIEESIKSIINQTYTNWELIICDDASTDNTVDIIKKIMVKEPRIILLENKDNMKLAYSLNRCFEESKGEFIGRMDDDDISVPERYQLEIDFLKQNPQYAVVGSNVVEFNKSGIVGVRSYPEYADLKNNRYNVSLFAHPSIVIRRNVLNDLNGYTVSKLTIKGQDYDLWAKMFSKGYIGYNIQKNLLYYRTNDLGYKKQNLKLTIYAALEEIKICKMLDFPFYRCVYGICKIAFTFIMPVKILKYFHEKKMREWNGNEIGSSQY